MKINKKDMKKIYQCIWQYGTEEWQDALGQALPSNYQGIPANSATAHLPWQQDGVAPQCAVPGLVFDETRQNNAGYNRRRIRFAGASDLLNFTEAHYGSSYGWIFDRFGELDAGYVSPRE